MTLGQRLRILRKNRNLTLKELSEKSGVTLPYLSKIERDLTSVSYSVVEKLASAYEMPMSDLTEGVNFKRSDLGSNYPKSFSDFLARFEEEHSISDDWKRTLLSINFCGQQPTTDLEWLELYLFLNRLFTSKNNMISGEDKLKERNLKRLDVEMSRTRKIREFETRQEELKEKNIDWWNDPRACKLADECHSLYKELILL